MNLIVDETDTYEIDRDELLTKLGIDTTDARKVEVTAVAHDYLVYIRVQREPRVMVP